MFSPVYNGGLTNHLPMMLESMRRLGFSNRRIYEVKKRYVESKNLEDAEKSSFGREFLRKREEHSNTDFHEFLSDKKYVIASGLFHHFIRLYFSLGNNEEMKSALSFFEMIQTEVILDFPLSNNAEKSLKKLSEARAKTEINFPHTGTMNKFNVLLNSPISKYFHSIDKVVVSDLLELFLTMFEETRSFYVLHVLTGFQAVLGLSEYIDLDDYLMEFYKYAQIFYVIGDDFTQSFEGTMTIQEGVSNAEVLQDAHDIKLLYSLTKLWEIDHNPKIKRIVDYIIQKG